MKQNGANYLRQGGVTGYPFNTHHWFWQRILLNGYVLFCHKRLQTSRSWMGLWAQMAK